MLFEGSLGSELENVIDEMFSQLLKKTLYIVSLLMNIRSKSPAQSKP